MSDTPKDSEPKELHLYLEYIFTSRLALPDFQVFLQVGMSRPTFVCVPGAAHSPIIYDPVKSALAYHGYEVVPLSLPSVGGTSATYDFTEDVRTIRNYIAQLADTGRDVILVMHGYSGIPGGEALRGLAKSDRERRGLRGGVIRLVFIMAVCYYFAFS
jgi:pimeloyl-ACP methyl ester carboxylesterase